MRLLFQQNCTPSQSSWSRIDYIWEKSHQHSYCYVLKLKNLLSSETIQYKCICVFNIASSFSRIWRLDFEVSFCGWLIQGRDPFRNNIKRHKRALLEPQYGDNEPDASRSYFIPKNLSADSPRLENKIKKGRPVLSDRGRIPGIAIFRTYTTGHHMSSLVKINHLCYPAILSTVARIKCVHGCSGRVTSHLGKRAPRRLLPDVSVPTGFILNFKIGETFYWH